MRNIAFCIIFNVFIVMFQYQYVYVLIKKFLTLLIINKQSMLKLGASWNRPLLLLVVVNVDLLCFFIIGDAMVCVEM